MSNQIKISFIYQLDFTLLKCIAQNNKSIFGEPYTVAETNGFEGIENIHQLVSFVGYDVLENQLRKRAGKTKISKTGNSIIRRILFLPAFNAVRYGEPSCQA